MDNNKEYLSLFSRFPLLTWMGAFFCFIIFPLAVANYGITSIFTTQNESIKTNTYKSMDNQLEFILNYANDSKYFHQILLHEFNLAKNSQNPKMAITNSIKMLKQKYPNCFKFIVWNKNGKPIKSITDEKGYRYVVRNLFKLFKAIAKAYNQDNNIAITNIPIVKTKINIFKNYLGKFLVPEHLKQPLLPKKVGSCILSDTENKQPLFWFNYSKKISVFCSINNNALNKNYGAIDAIRLLRKQKQVQSHCGIVAMSDKIKVFPEMTPSALNEFIVEFGKFENSSLPHIESKNHLISFKLLTSNLRGFSIVRKETLLTNIVQLKKLLLATLFKILVPLLFVFYCFKLRKDKLFVSIKWKLAFLFLYANGLPLIILGVIGTEYLEQSKVELLQNFHNQNITLAAEIDRGFTEFLQELSKNVTKKLAIYEQEYPIYSSSKIDIKQLQKFRKDLNAHSINIFNKNSDIIAHVSKSKTNTSKAFMKLIAGATIQHANLKINSNTNQIVHSKSTASPIQIDVLSFIGKVYRLFNKVTELSLITNRNQSYIHLVFDPTKQEFHSMFVISFDPENLQKRYIENKIKYFNASHKTTSLIALLKGTSTLISDNKPIFSTEQNKLINQIQKASSFQIVKNNNFSITNTPYALTEIAGKEMGDTILAFASPLSDITFTLRQVKLYALIFLVLNIIISLTIFYMISKQFIEPINSLGLAISEIGKHNFRFQTNIETNDEFSELGNTINSTIEGMSDLEVGSIVQENLFPSNSFKDNRIEIYAKSVSMTKMGGDYYDYFKLGNDLTGIFMGDVAGHGIPAAMITAMVKASLIIQKEEKLIPSSLVSNLHKMLYRIKSKKFKRMMTCQYFVIDQKTGKITIANAGHCYPVKLSKDGTNAQFIEIPGVPIGIMKRAKFTDSELSILPGETLILYSDGIVESQGKNGQEFGFKRFLKLLQDSWEDDIEKFYQNIYSTYLDWSPQADDDITIVVVRYKKATK